MRRSTLKGFFQFTVHDSTYLTFLKHHSYKNRNYMWPEVKEGGVSIEKRCAYSLC